MSLSSGDNRLNYTQVHCNRPNSEVCSTSSVRDELFCALVEKRKEEEVEVNDSDYSEEEGETDEEDASEHTSVVIEVCGYSEENATVSTGRKLHPSSSLALLHSQKQLCLLSSSETQNKKKRRRRRNSRQKSLCQVRRSQSCPNSLRFDDSAVVESVFRKKDRITSDLSLSSLTADEKCDSVDRSSNQAVDNDHNTKDCVERNRSHKPIFAFGDEISSSLHEASSVTNSDRVVNSEQRVQVAIPSAASDSQLRSKCEQTPNCNNYFLLNLPNLELDAKMDSIPLHDYFYGEDLKRRDENAVDSRCADKQRFKCNTVMSRIKKFAKSQSQARSSSLPASNNSGADNIVSKTMDFCKDVKKRFSQNNPLQANSSSDEVFAKDNDINPPSALTSSNSTTTVADFVVDPITKLRRYASDESLQSDSGCGSSVKTGSLSTDSNRSSICTIEDVNSSGVLFRGPFIGQARAVIDCTPCPYDKDALAFKKGDIVNIIAKNDSGTWIGMANGKIGHFKFISVEESQNVKNHLSKFNYRMQPKAKTSGSLITETTSNAAIARAGLDSDHIFEEIKSVLRENDEICIEKLFELFDINEIDYLRILRENSYETIKSLKCIENQGTLKAMGITNVRYQNLILYVAKMVRESISENEEDSDTFQCETIKREGNRCHEQKRRSTMRKDSHNHNHNNHLVAQSAPTTPALEYSRDSLCDWFLEIDLSSQDWAGEDRRNSRLKSNENDEEVKELCKIKTEDLLLSPKTSDEKTDDKAGARLKRSETVNSDYRQLCGKYEYDDRATSERSTPQHHEKKGGANIRSSNIDEDALIEGLRHECSEERLRKNSCHKQRKMSNSASNSSLFNIKSGVMSSKSVLDLCINSSIPANVDVNQGSHNYMNTRKRLKKLLLQQSDKKHGNANRNCENTINRNEHHYNSMHSLHITSKPISANLLDSISHLLKDEQIDLTEQPYSDCSGFCGIPPALVQRYSEELNQDIYDVADAVDHIRLGSLMHKGRSGIPNDFLGDSCTGPIVEKANYENLKSWLISIGLPMYENAFIEHNFSDLSLVSQLRENDLTSVGIVKSSHRRLLTDAICALSVNLHKVGKV